MCLKQTKLDHRLNKLKSIYQSMKSPSKFQYNFSKKQKEKNYLKIYVWAQKIPISKAFLRKKNNARSTTILALNETTEP